jgi:phytanoyl-CoA hydroxylase
MLTKEQVAFYQEHGYLLVERLLTQQEAQELRRECHALAQRLSIHTDMDATWGSARKAVAQAKHTTILHCHNVQFYSAAFSRLLVDERLTGAAADIIDSPNVQLHHTKMFIKPPEKGSPFPLHQDYPFFPHERQSMMAAIFHFDDAPLRGDVCASCQAVTNWVHWTTRQREAGTCRWSSIRWSQRFPVQPGPVMCCS